MYEPAVVNVWLGLCAVDVAPSPNRQAHAYGVEPPLAEPVKLIVAGALAAVCEAEEEATSRSGPPAAPNMSTIGAAPPSLTVIVASDHAVSIVLSSE